MPVPAMSNDSIEKSLNESESSSEENQSSLEIIEAENVADAGSGGSFVPSGAPANDPVAQKPVMGGDKADVGDEEEVPSTATPAVPEVRAPKHMRKKNQIFTELEDTKQLPRAQKAKSRAGNKAKNLSKAARHNAAYQEAFEYLNDSPSDSDESINSENDPNKLWCICRKPDNNRFMICCDSCEDWFHGMCVNVTKAMGKAMETVGQEWICPTCVDLAMKALAPLPIKELNKVAAKKTRNDPNKLWCICRKPDNNRFMICCDSCEDWFHGKCVNVTKAMGKTKELAGQEWMCPTCVDLTKKALAPLPIKEVNKVAAKKTPDRGGAPVAATVSLGKKQPVKRTQVMLEAPIDKKAKFVTKPKSPVSSWAKVMLCILCNNQARPYSAYCSDICILKHAENVQSASPIAAPPSKTKYQPQELKTKADVSPTLHTYAKSPVQSPVKAVKNVVVKSRPSTETSIPESAGKPEVEVLPGPEPVRVSVRETLHSLLLARLKECDDLKTIPDEEVKKLGYSIEEELYALFTETGSKYKSKYRRLVFNIKDPSNLTLFRKIAEKLITPKQLVRLQPEELASQQLALWREQESKNQLEIIKKNALDLLAMSNTVVMRTHKGEQIIESDDYQNETVLDFGIGNVNRSLVTSTVTDVTLSSHKSSSSKKSESKSRSSSHSSKNKSKYQKREGHSRHRVKESSRHREKSRHSGSSSHHSRDSDSSSEDSKESQSQASSLKGFDVKIEEKAKMEEEEMKDALWTGCVTMQDLVQFVGSLHSVLGNFSKGCCDIPATLDIVGRIVPEVAWEYISKMKRSGTAEISVMRFTPVGEDQMASYKFLHTYLRTRDRLGVAGDLPKSMKDLYVLPLPPHSPLPQVLLPLDGPGLEERPSHLLLGIVVRRKIQSSSLGGHLDVAVGPSPTPPPEDIQNTINELEKKIAEKVVEIITMRSDMIQ